MGYLGGLTGSRLVLVATLLVTAPSFLCYGYNQTVAGGLLTQPAFYQQFPQIDTMSKDLTDAQQAHNSTIQGTTISLYVAGGIFGALATCIWGDRLGRRNTIFLSTIVVVIGAVLMCSSHQFVQLIIARVILGLGTGGTSSTVPVWTSELAKISNRGGHTSAVGLWLSVGLSLGLWIDLGMSFVKSSSVSWRFPLGLQILFCAIPMSTIYFLPESPRWLLTRGRDEEAQQIMAVINELEPDNELIVNEVRDIKRSLEIASQASLKDIFHMGDTRIMHRTFLALLAMFFSQVCAINAITFYANTIFETYLHMSPVIAQVLSGCMTFTQIIASGFASYVIDKLGRRKLMLFSGVGMTICMALLAGLTADPENKKALNAAVFALFAINFIYSVGFAGVCFCYAAETSPLYVRSIVNGCAVAVTWATNFLVAMVSPVAMHAISWKYYLVWTAVNGIMITPIVFFFFPETKQRSPEELDEIFLQSKSIFDTVGIAKRMPYRNQLNPITGVDEEAGLSTPVEEVTVATDMEKK